MTVGTVRSQGSELFFIDMLTDSNTRLVKLACPTGISGLGGAADQIEDTCLDTVGDRTYKRGLGTPGQVSVPFNFIPTDTGHQLLLDLKDSGDTIPWMISLSDGTADPTIADDHTLVAPASRSSIGFSAYIADVNIDIATNEIVRGTLTLQRSGSIVGYWNAPTPTV